MRTLAILGLALLLVTCAAGVAGIPKLPYAALEDMKESDVVDRNYVRCDILVPAFALHPEGKGWWMLWITAQTWIMSYFGDGEEPASGARPQMIYYGRWEVEGPADTSTGERHLYKLDHMSRDPGPEKSAELFCDWLLPPEKPSA